MDVAIALAGTTVRVVGAVSTRAGVALAMPMFGHVARPRPVHPDDRPTMERARRGVVRIPGIDRRGADVVTYEWGTGPRTAVVAHGWNGRASQFSLLVRELVADGFRVLAFDAPAHGDSRGRQTYLVDWVDVMRELQARRGRFDLMVGHSFGGLAALVAVAGGVQAARVVTIAAPADADLLLRQFQGLLGYSTAVATGMREQFASRYFPGEVDPYLWLSSVRRPLPAGVPLLVVHDRGDRMVPFGEAERIAGANREAHLLATTRLGHNRILAADAVLDAVSAFAAADVAPRPVEPATDDAAEPAAQQEPVGVR